MTIHTENKVWGMAKNPLDTARTCGGSSGGDAGLVGGLCVPLAIGSDLAGSLRIPAAFTGVKSFKPTPGRVSLEGWLMVLRNRGISPPPLKFISASPGPIARSVSDLLMVFKLMLHP